MKVLELVNKFNNEGFEPNSLITRTYVPVIEKRRFALDVISACTDDIDDFVTVNKFMMNIYFDMNMLGVYTNLDIPNDFDEMIDQYDMLCEYGIMNKFIDLFVDEYYETWNILEGELDLLLVQNSVDAQIVKVANKVNKIIDVLGDKLNCIDFNAILPEGTDINQLIDMINLLK